MASKPAPKKAPPKATTPAALKKDAGAAVPARRRTDWEAVERDYRTGKFTLRELEGLSYEEIAEIMDCPVGTVRSRIFRAREAIDKKLQPLIEN